MWFELYYQFLLLSCLRLFTFVLIFGRTVIISYWIQTPHKANRDPASSKTRLLAEDLRYAKTVQMFRRFKNVDNLTHLQLSSFWPSALCSRPQVQLHINERFTNSFIVLFNFIISKAFLSLLLLILLRAFFCEILWMPVSAWDCVTQ